MSSVLDNPAIRNRAHLLSVKEYHALGDLGFLSKRTELIEGVVIEKMPKSPRHATFVKKIFRSLSLVVPKGYHVASEQPITLKNSEPEPDISIVKGSIDDYANAHPTRAELVVEVSFTTLSEDRSMAFIYAESSIPEYWLFNLNNNTVEVYTKPMQDRYSEMKTYSQSDILTLSSMPEIKIQLSDLF
jgi:Uma2 family endonuclease